MTISTTNAKKVFLANGVTTVFGWDFYVPDLASLVVQSLSPAGVLTTVSNGFTASGLNTSSGAVTFVSAPASGYQIILSRVIGYSQTVDLTNQDGFYPEVIEGALDRLTMLSQQLKEQVDRSIKGNIADTITLVLPSQTLRANKVMAFDGDGQAIVADISNQAAAAAASAASALSYANSAGSAQAAAEAARDASLASYDNFDDRFLGPKASDPTVDNDGNALLTGAIYFNTTSQAMKVWIGSSWVAAYVSGSGYLAASNNLSDISSASVARANLGISTVGATGAYSDLSGKPTLGTAAALAAGTGIGNVLQLDGSSKIPAVDGSQLTGLNASQVSGLSSGAALGTAQATTSGSAKDFTGLSGLKRIQMIFDQVQTGASSSIRLGTSGGFLTSGYSGYHLQLAASGIISSGTYSSNFFMDIDPINGIVTLDHVGGNVWVMNGILTDASTGGINIISGRISLGGALTQVRFVGGSTFTAGQVNIITE